MKKKTFLESLGKRQVVTSTKNQISVTNYLGKRYTATTQNPKSRTNRYVRYRTKKEIHRKRSFRDVNQNAGCTQTLNLIFEIMKKRYLEKIKPIECFWIL